MKKLNIVLCRFLVILILMPLFMSCGISDYQFNDIEVQETDAKMAAPLAKGSFTLWDFIGNVSQENLKKDEYGNMSFVYSHKNVFSYSLDDLYQFPSSISIGQKGIDIPPMDFDRLRLLGQPILPIEFTSVHRIDISGGSNSSLKAFSAKVKRGTLNVNVSNPSLLTGIGLDIIVQNCIVDRNGEQKPLKINIPLESGVRAYTVDLAGALLDFGANKTSPEFTITYKVVFPSNITGKYDSSSFTFDLNMLGLEFEYFKGDLGAKEFTLPTNVIDIDVPFLDKIGKGIQFSEPVFTLTTKTNFIVSSAINPSIVGTNLDDEEVDVNAPDLNVVCPVESNIDQAATGTYTLNKDNSNIVELFSLPPSKKITFGGRVVVNTNTDGTPMEITPSNPNMITPTSGLSADLSMEVPLIFKASDISYTDTLEVSISDISSVDNAALYISYENQIPLELDINLLPVNIEQNTIVGEPIAVEPFKSPKVDEPGRPISISKGIEKLSLTTSDLESLQKADALIMHIKANSSENKVVRLNASDILNVRIAASANVKYNENN
ncbi:MAG: hypothetical protein N4A37_10875 [Prolixibacteraceae bacterium]|nr:hypothetical protein [Prolixibacteraceae bacterium]